MAAHARVLSALVVTPNTRKFQQVENLKAEDWVKGR
jgi:predicted nucleic acid-binding protein